ncbi:hypothetical protein [Rothia dentocariosa]|uniref:hypothetical protein n=1 Tax=Rothia dentocariosa TaxID=2047 RepID=UPI0021145E0F|nr:hypothetical protein [Rothia dentocariosa]
MWSVILSSTLGFFLGSSFLAHLEGFDFVMTALFTVLALDAYRANPDRLTVLFSVIAAAVALIIAPGSMLLVAMAVYMALLVGRYAAAKKRGSLPQHMLGRRRAYAPSHGTRSRRRDSARTSTIVSNGRTKQAPRHGKNRAWCLLDRLSCVYLRAASAAS